MEEKNEKEEDGYDWS